MVLEGFVGEGFKVTESANVGFVVFFDGRCRLCNAWANLLLRADTNRKLAFAPLGGATAKKRLPPELAGTTESLVFEYRGTFHTGARAVSAIAHQLPPPWRILALFRFVPFSEAIYRLVAANRYRIFGVEEACPMPTDRERFLD